MSISSSNQFYSRCDLFLDRLTRFRNDAFDFGISDSILSDIDTSIYLLNSVLSTNNGGYCYGKEEDETKEG